MKNVDIISKVVSRKVEGTGISSKGDSLANLSDYLLKSIWGKAFEIRTDNTGNEYIFGKLPVVTQYGITMYAQNEVDIPTILDSIPTATSTSKGLASFDSSYFTVDADGKVSLIEDNVGLNETQLESYLTQYNYAKKSDIPSLSDYATQTWVETRIDSLINGAPAAYDTLKEIADVLDGNVNSIGDIITTLGTKADKSSLASTDAVVATKWTQDNTKISNWDTAYSWGNHASVGYALKTYVDTEFAKYVTLSTAQTITGEKNFTGGLKVNGSSIVYDSSKKYWKLEGDLLVTGGVTMYGSDSEFVPSTIMDAILYDDSTLGINDNGELYVKGSVGGSSTLGGLSNVGSWADSAADVDRVMYQQAGSSMWVAKSLSDYATQSWTSSQLSGYLPLSGGTMSGDITLPYNVFIKCLETGNPILGYSADGMSLMVGDPNLPLLLLGSGATLNGFVLLTDGNYSSYAAPKTGSTSITTLGTITSGTWNGSKIANAYLANSSITINGTSTSLGGSFNTASITAGTAGTSSATSGYTLAVPYVTMSKYGIVTGYGTHTHTINSIPNSSLVNSSMTIAGTSVSLGGSITAATLKSNLGLGSNAYTSTAYLPLTGGTLSGSVYLGGTTTNWIGTNLLGTGYQELVHKNSHGYISIGPFNESHAHIYTDRGDFYFNKELYVNDNTVWHSGNLTPSNYLLASSYTASDVLAKLKTVDGIGSELDADTLDGVHNGSLTASSCTGNAATATKLQTARTIWGQSFDGTGNVDGNMLIKGQYVEITLQGTNSYNTGICFNDYEGNLRWYLSYRGLNDADKDFYIYRHMDDNSYHVAMSLIRSNGNVGIGTTLNTGHRLSVDGDSVTNNIRTQSIMLGLSNVSSIHVSDRWYYASITYENEGQSPSYLNPALVFKTMNNTYKPGTEVERMRLCSNGNLSIGYAGNKGTKLYVDGNILAYGGITMYSDQRKKTILNHVELSLKQIAEAPLIEHYYNGDEKKTTHVGSIAQYWASMNDWFCKLDSEGYYTMEIQNAALASAISIARELDRYETKTDKTIRELREKIALLEDEVEQLKREKHE